MDHLSLPWMKFSNSDLRIPQVGGTPPGAADMGPEEGVLKGDILQGSGRRNVLKNNALHFCTTEIESH